MNDISQINESFDLSKDYYYFIRDTINDYSKYIKQYKLINISISKKLSQFQEKFGQNLLDKEKIKNKYKNFDINNIYEITSIVPNIIQQLINNFNFVAKSLEPVIQSLDNIFNEKINVENKLEYESIKNNINKSYKNIDKNKNIFFNKMNNVEDTIYKYYLNKYKNYQNNSDEKNNTTHNKEKNENLITMEQLNAVINDGKKIEAQYLSCFDTVEGLENSFDEISKKLNGINVRKNK